MMPRPYWFLLASQVVNRFGDGFYFISLSWLIYGMTGSALALGGMWFAYTTAVALVQAVAAPLTDRLDRRRLMIWLDIARGLMTLIPVALYTQGALRPWHIYLVFVAVGVLGTPYGASSGALVPQLVPAAGLTRANAWLEGGTEAMYLVGPAVGGFFIAAFGAPAGLLVNATSFLASAGLIAFVRVSQATVPEVRPTDRQPYLRSLGSGWGTLVRDPLLLFLAVLQIIVALTDTVFVTLVVPYAQDALGSTATGVGFLEAAMSAGVILASLVVARGSGSPALAAANSDPPGARLTGLPLSLWLAVPLFCVATGALALVHSLAPAIVLQVVAGAVVGLFSIRVQTAFQTRVDNRRLGGTLMTRNALRSGAQAIGAVVAGAIAAKMGVAVAFAAFGVIGLLLSSSVASLKHPSTL